MTVRGQHFLNLVGKEVELLLVDGSATRGRVYTVDPETHNFLLTFEAKTVLVPYTNISKVNLISRPSNNCLAGQQICFTN